MKFPVYVFLLRIFRSLVIFCMSVTHLASLFESCCAPYFMSVLSNVLPDDNDDLDSVRINNVNKKIDKALDIVSDIVRPIATLAVGGAAIATVVKTVPTPHGKAIVASVGLSSMFFAPAIVSLTKKLPPKGNGGHNFLAFSMNAVQGDPSLLEQCLAYTPITIFFLKLLVIALSAELFKRVLFDWISKFKYFPKSITKFVLKGLDKLQSISSVYVTVIIGIMWLNIFNLTLLLRCLQVLLPKTEYAALLNTYLYYEWILTLIYFVLTLLVVVILFGNSILTWLSKLWFLLEFQVVRMLERSNLLATQARLLAESNKARHFTNHKETLSPRLFLAILLFSMWVVSLFLGHYYTLCLQCC
jgi:hypothetical protein